MLDYLWEVFAESPETQNLALILAFHYGNVLEGGQRQRLRRVATSSKGGNVFEDADMALHLLSCVKGTAETVQMARNFAARIRPGSVQDKARALEQIAALVDMAWNRTRKNVQAAFEATFPSAAYELVELRNSLMSISTSICRYRYDYIYIS